MSNFSEDCDNYIKLTKSDGSIIETAWDNQAFTDEQIDKCFKSYKEAGPKSMMLLEDGTVDIQW